MRARSRVGWREEGRKEERKGESERRSDEVRARADRQKRWDENERGARMSSEIERDAREQDGRIEGGWVGG